MRAETRRLVLASTSPYRKALLERLGVPFETAAPGVDEAARPGESPGALALRLAEEKARSAGTAFPDALVIGSDQVASCEGERISKPGGHARAVEQLRRLSGRVAEFHTGIALFDAASGAMQSCVVPCRVTFRALDDRTIEAYLRREQPYDCAGSAKSEGLGIALIERMETEDPTSLVGLPLIALTAMLAAAGRPVL